MRGRVRALGRRTTLRVGVRAEVTEVPPISGHARMWNAVLGELRALPSVRLVDRGKADVWLASATAPPDRHRPLVVQVHEVSWRTEPLRSWLAEDFADRLEGTVTAALEVAARVITPSEAARHQVIEAYGWPSDRVRAVHHGVDHTVFRPGLSGGRDLIGAPYVLFVGVLHPRKNLEALRAAMSGLAAEGLPHSLVAVANPAADREEEAGVQARLELAEHPGRVRLLRGVDDATLASLMAGADAFCLPSWFEGFGMPALEAMACGAPVIVSNRGALPEVVGTAGLVVDPEPAAVQAALRRVLGDQDLAERLRTAGLRRAAQFDWRKTAEGWLEVLRTAAR